MDSRKFGKYVLEREVGHTRLSRTYRATLIGAHGLERRMLIETVTDRAHARRMEENAKALVGLQHPNIAPIHEVGLARGMRYAALEPVDGATLGEIAHASRVSPDEGAYVGVEVWRALEYARREKNVALDEVNAESIVIDEEGRVHLMGITVESPALADDARALAETLLQAWGGSEATRPSTIDIRLLPLDETIARVMRSASGARDADDLGEALKKYLGGIDALDVARTLAEKVREAKERRPPSDRGHDFPMPGSEDGMTRPLAARSEFRAWTKEEAARTPPSLDSLVHKIPSSMPPPPRIPESIKPAVKPGERAPRVRRPPKPLVYFIAGVLAAALLVTLAFFAAAR